MPFFQFPSVLQQTIWGTISGNIRLQTDLIDMVKNLSLSELAFVVDFSKYGEISANEYFFPNKIILLDGQKAEIVGYEVGLSDGVAVVNVQKNSVSVAQLSLIQASTDYFSTSLSEPIELAQNDILSLSITQSENAQNFLFRLIIRVAKKNES